jgi:hypothetical protein
MTQEEKERLTRRSIKGAKIRWQLSMQTQLKKAHALLAEMEYGRREGQYDGEA